MTIVQKTALITGCSEPESLGAALALNLKSNGYRVFATARNLETLKGLAAEGCDILELDVQDSESIRNAAKEVELLAGRLDLLINNAGVAQPVPILDMDVERAKMMLDINVLGPIRTVQGFSSLLIRTANDLSITKDNSSPVAIINIGSVARLGMPWNGIYGGSKAALETVSTAMRYEFANLNVKVGYVHLGSVKTAMLYAKKSFPMISTETSGFFSNWEEIRAAMAIEAKKNQEMGLTPTVAATQILANHYKGNYPGGGWYAGGGAFLLKYMFPWFPRFVKDRLFVQFGRSDLVQRPEFR